MIEVARIGADGMTTDWREGWVDDDKEGIHEPGILGV